MESWEMVKLQFCRGMVHFLVISRITWNISFRSA